MASPHVLRCQADFAVSVVDDDFALSLDDLVAVSDGLALVLELVLFFSVVVFFLA
jgi:hypothetical protein